MFKAKKQTPAKDAPGKGRRRLTRAERREIDAAIRRAARTDKKELSAQDSIPYQRMWPDGVCRVTDTYYTKMVQFQDINYQLSQNEDKAAIFEGWCDFLNYFDSSIRFQFSFLNLAATRESYEKRIVIPPQGDDFDSIRAEYTEMLQNQLARGNNGLVKTKYLTFGIDAESVQEAKPRLERIETDLLNHFKRLGVAGALRPVYQGLHRPHAPGISGRQDLPHGPEVRRGVLPPNSGPGAERPYSGGFSGYGVQSCGVHARPVCGSGQRHQDHQA